MAKNYLIPFANGKDANIASEAEWESAEMHRLFPRVFSLALRDRIV